MGICQLRRGSGSSRNSFSPSAGPRTSGSGHCRQPGTRCVAHHSTLTPSSLPPQHRPSCAALHAPRGLCIHPHTHNTHSLAHTLMTHIGWRTRTQTYSHVHTHNTPRPNPPCLLLAIASAVPPCCCDFPFFVLQAKAEHLAAVEEQRRIREDMYMRQMEEQARQEAEARAQVRGCVVCTPPRNARHTSDCDTRHASSHRSTAPHRVHQHPARAGHWQGMSSFWVHG